MKLGIRPFQLHRGDPLAQVSLAARLGAGCVQLDAPPGELVEPIAAAARDAGIAIGSLCAMPGAILHDGEAGVRAVAGIAGAIESAARMRVPAVTVFAGEHPELDQAGVLQRFADRFGPLTARAEVLGVSLAMENCPLWNGERRRAGNLAHSPARWRQLFAAVPSPALGLDLDLGHLPALGIDPAAAIRAAAGRIRHVQIKDVAIDRDGLADHGCLGGMPHRFCLPGDGEIDFTACFAAFADVGYDGCAVVDVHGASEAEHARALAYLGDVLAAKASGPTRAAAR